MINKIKEEINKISLMDREKKIEYFKSYYLVKSIVALVCLIMLIWFIKDTCFKNEAVSMGCAYGVELTDSQREALTNGYLEYYGYDPAKCDAVIVTDDMFEGTEQKMDASSHEMALYAQIAAGEIYYLILNKEKLELMSSGGIFSSLPEVLAEDDLQKIEELIVDVPDYETSEPVPTAIDLRKLGFMDNEGYLVFTIKPPSEEYPSQLLNYLFAISFN